MRILIAILVTVSLTGCFDKGPKAKLIKTIYENVTTTSTVGDPDPAAGTLLSWGCDDYTRLNEIADGQGGSSTEEIERSPDCGWNPPEAGTVSETRCEDPYTLVTVYNDGEYGFYEEEDENNEECGYVPPSVSIVKDSGDRFDPVVFSIETALPDEHLDFEVTLGKATREGDELFVHGTGATGEGILLIDDEEYQYSINPEPRCERIPGFADCQNYHYSGPTKGYIYYGEDDDRIVEWEIAIIHYTSEECDPEIRECSFGEGVVAEWQPGDVDWDWAVKRVERYNLAYERSGVNIRYVLKPGFVVDAHYHGVNGINRVIRLMDVDVGIGLGNTCPGTCGCAYVNTSFIENSGKGIGGVSVCGWDTDLHEIGHAVGLAHGPQNMANQASGYIWREFGHGWDAFCSYYSDIMSYGASSYTHHNSRLTCGEMYDWVTGPTIERQSENPAGSREYADSAYHLNRIRYDVSLINCEDDLCASSAQSDEIEEPPSGLLIEDKVSEFEDGYQRRERFLSELPARRREVSGTTHEH